MPEYEPSPWDFVADQVAKYEASGGRVGGDNGGVPVAILTTVGRKTGKLRKSPLIRFSDGEKYAVIASMGGAPKHPEWYLNILAEPEVTLQDGDDIKRYCAHTAEGDERARWWAKVLEVWPDSAEYQKRTSRQIPVVVLEAMETPR